MTGFLARLQAFAVGFAVALLCVAGVALAIAPIAVGGYVGSVYGAPWGFAAGIATLGFDFGLVFAFGASKVDP